MALLTLIQQQTIKTISPNWANSGKSTGGKSNYDQLAEEVEEKEMYDALGVPFSQDIQDNPLTPANVIVLDGGTYEDCNGNTVKFKGLRYILAYFNWSAYIDESYVSDSFTGMVSKNRPEARDMTAGEKKNLRSRGREIALRELELLKNFLNENSTDYPLWECTNTSKIYKPTIRGVRKTIN